MRKRDDANHRKDFKPAASPAQPSMLTITIAQANVHQEKLTSASVTSTKHEINKSKADLCPLKDLMQRLHGTRRYPVVWHSLGKSDIE
jgi:hypothetical protein